MSALVWTDRTPTTRKGAKSEWLHFEGFAPTTSTAIVLCRRDVGGTTSNYAAVDPKWKWFVSMPHQVEDIEVLGGDMPPDVAKQQATVTLRSFLRRLTLELGDLP